MPLCGIGFVLGRDAPVSNKWTSQASLRQRWHTAEGDMSCTGAENKEALTTHTEVSSHVRGVSRCVC
jgi:hypothetical protein